MDNLKQQINALLEKCLIIPAEIKNKILAEIPITFSEGRLNQILEKLKKYNETEKLVINRLQKKDPSFLGKVKHAKTDIIQKNIKEAEIKNIEQEHPEDILKELDDLFNN